jgi:hypothetical protein
MPALSKADWMASEKGLKTGNQTALGTYDPGVFD